MEKKMKNNISTSFPLLNLFHVKIIGRIKTGNNYKLIMYLLKITFALGCCVIPNLVYMHHASCIRGTQLSVP